MKKIISILALVLAITAVFCVSAFAEETATTYSGFYDIETVTGVTVTPKAGATAVTTTTALDVDLVETEGVKDDEAVYNGSDSLTVTAPATSGAYCGVLLVKGSALPTVDSEILYIDQKTASDSTITFDVLPKLPAEVGVVKLYVSSNAEGAELIAVPMGYAPTAAYAPAVNAPAGYPKGDVDNNGLWNATDASMALQIGANIYNATDVEATAADVDENDIWNATDASMILQYGAGIIDSWD